MNKQQNKVTMIKKHLTLLVMLGMALSLVITSCRPKQHVYLSKKNVIFAPVGGVRTVKVYADCKWTAELVTGGNWCNVEPMEGDLDGTLTIRVGEYNETEDRNAIIRIISENGKIKKDITVTQRRITMEDIINKVWFLHFYERWDTDYYGEFIEDSYRTWHYYAEPEYDNWFFYFLEDSTGYQWRAKNHDTVYYAFSYVYYPLEDSLYINYVTDSTDVVEDYLAIVEKLDDEEFIFQNEYKSHQFERLTMANVSPNKKTPFVKPAKVMKKPKGPIIQVEN